MNTNPRIPLQQTIAWQNLQQSLNETTFFLSDDPKNTNPKKHQPSPSKTQKSNPETTSSAPVNYQMLIIKKSTPVGPYFFLPYGPYLRQKTAAKPAYEALNHLAKAENVIFTRIEPQNAENASYWLTRPETKKSKDLSPKETWTLDLTPPLDEIYAHMKQTTRNLAKNYPKKGLRIEKVPKTPENLEIFYHFLTAVAEHNHFHPLERPTFDAEVSQPFSSLYFAYYTPSTEDSKKTSSAPTSPETASQKSKTSSAQTAPPQKTTPPAELSSQEIPVAASLFFDHGDTRYYMQSGAAPAYRKLPATIAILSEAIKDAKSQNLKNFDFWGIAPENADRSHPWYGFTSFKKSFGGQEVTYAGTHDIIYKPLHYRLYKLLRRFNRWLRRV